MAQEHQCFEVASAGEPPYLREFQLQVEGKVCFIKISCPDYLKELRSRNATNPLSARSDENIHVIQGVTAEQFGQMEEGQICQILAKTPLDLLQPYLTEQENSE